MADPASDPLLRDALAQARAFGFLGPGPVEAHVAHSTGLAAVVADVLAQQPAGLPDRALDLGSGGGVPGMLLALAFPQLSWLLLDSQERRTAFLADRATRWAVPPFAVLRSRAEEAARLPGHRGQYRLVVARSFGPPAVTAECAAGFLAPGGVVVVAEPPDQDAGHRWDVEGLRALGLRLGASWRVPVAAQALIATEAPLPHVPRRVGVPAKRPRF